MTKRRKEMGVEPTSSRNFGEDYPNLMRPEVFPEALAETMVLVANCNDPGLILSLRLTEQVEFSLLSALEMLTPGQTVEYREMLDWTATPSDKIDADTRYVHEQAFNAVWVRLHGLFAAESSAHDQN